MGKAIFSKLFKSTEYLPTFGKLALCAEQSLANGALWLSLKSMTSKPVRICELSLSSSV